MSPTAWLAGRIRRWLRDGEPIMVINDAPRDAAPPREQPPVNAVSTELLASMWHEIRTPLNGVIGMAELLRNTDLSERQSHFCKTILESSQSLLSMLNDVLDLSRIETGNMELTSSEFDLAALIRDSIKPFADLAAERRIELICRSNVDARPMVCGDPLRLQQVLNNLLSNAVKFTERGAVVLDVQRSESPRGPQVMFGVRDSGIGIATERLAGLFDSPGTPTTAAPQRGQGTGLGLVISRQLVAMLGGQLNVVSRLGEGSTFAFTIVLPDATVQADTAAAVSALDLKISLSSTRATPPLWPAVATTTEQSLEVLLAEDHLVNQEVAIEHLRALGCVVTVANNGAEALRLFSQRRFALVFMDCQMPVMDGYHATRSMRAIEHERGQSRTPIVALTANALRGDRDKCLVAGMDDFYSKPFVRHDLESALTRWIPTWHRTHAATVEPVAAASAIPPRMPSSSCIDAATWQQLTSLGDRSPGLIDRILASFLAEAIEIAPLLSATPNPTTVEALHFAAHRMKSAARSLGAMALGDQLGELESACQAGQIGTAPFAAQLLTVHGSLTDALLALSVLSNKVLALTARPGQRAAIAVESISPEMAASAPTDVSTSDGKGGTTQHNGRVLIADDDDVSRSIIAGWLRSDGYLVVEASDGQIALDCFARDEFDLILLDVLMPAKNGYEACHHIRQQAHGQHVPIVILTGLDDKEAVHFAYECGATDFIVKPVVEEILRNRLRYLQRAGRLSDDLRRSEARLRHTQLTARVSYWEWDPDARQMLVGEGVKHLANLAAADLSSIDAVKSLFSADDMPVIDNILAGMAVESEVLEYLATTDAGEERYISQRIERIVDTVTNRARWLGTVQDITEQRRNEQRIYRMSHFDSLTGMPNHLFLRKSLGLFLKLAARQDKRVAYLVVDSGEQQQIASALGHDYHDQYVLEISNRLRTQLRGSDLFVRLPDPDGLTTSDDTRAALVHGDRFSAALNAIDGHDDVARICERLIEALSVPIELGSEALFPRINIGIALFPEDGDDFETLHQHALTALNQTGDKQSGYHWYQQERDAAARERIALERDLRYAVERGELRVFYQPRLDAHSGAVLGMEALVRWQRDGQMVSPAKFIPIAEQTGVINQLGEFVLERSVAMVAAWLKRGLPPLRVSVNVSGRQFRESDLPAQCSAALARHNLPAEYLELELTEGILIEASDNVLQQLHMLKDLGIQLALDDFGTGFSSLGYLSRFPLDVLKIDKSFVDKLADNEQNRVIVRSTLTLAHDLGLRVVAEGVETEAQRHWLVEHACDELQGYLFAKPLPPEEFEQWVLQRRNLSSPPLALASTVMTRNG